MKPDYATHDRLANLLGPMRPDTPLLCPHCRGLLLPARATAPKTAASGDGKRSPTGSGKPKRPRKRRSGQPAPPAGPEPTTQPPAGSVPLDPGNPGPELFARPQQES